MWQDDTFDLPTIERELGMARSLGFNTVRTNLQFLVWEPDPAGQKRKLDRFLGTASKLGISTMLCLFDDCCHSWKQPWTGKQDEPRPGIHNSCWTPSPGHAIVMDPPAWKRLRKYVVDIVGSFAGDPRILCWDIYNEPGNWDGREKSLPLLMECFGWARSAHLLAPITSGVWHSELGDINRFLLGNSDVISFHDYNGLDATERQVKELEVHGRPIMCTEYMARSRGSRFETHLPFFREKGIGCYNWGLVNGRTQTQFPWDSKAGSPDPDPWFHDIFRRDGNPYRPEEVELIRRITGAPGTGGPGES